MKKTPKHYRRPLQERSERTSQRIIDATLALLGEKTFEEMSLAEIAGKAGISIGGFYACFYSKEALLHWFDENLLEQQLRADPPWFKVERIKDEPLPEMIRLYLTRVAAHSYRYRTLLARIALRVRAKSDPDYTRRARKYNREVHGEFLRLLLSKKREFTHPDPKFAVRFGLMSVMAALREEILFGERNLYGVRVKREQLIQELTRMYLSYLGVPTRAQ